MARVTGPALSVEALGPLGGALTFSRTQGGRVAKLTPRRSNRPSGPDRATRTAMSFAQRAWTADIIANGFNQDWEDLARQKNLPPYNAFLSDALANTRKNLAPRISPITSVGDLPGTINTPTYTLSGTTITLTFTFASEDDTWGIWTHVDDHSIYRPAPTNVIGFADVLSTKIGQPLTTVIAKLAHGSINWLQFTVFSFDGTSQLAATILGPILVP